MAYDAKTERLISLKKLAGKAQTSNDKGLSNEALPSGITATSKSIFGESVTTSPSNTSLYTITGQVEYLRFPSTFIAGSDTSDGRHGFELKLPSDYESNSSNSKAGTYPFQNDQVINITSGSLQLIPPSFATSYEAKPYYGGSSSKGSGTLIPLLDARDWYLDYFNGVFFQQDPSGTGDQADNPDFIEGYLYIGDMLDTVVASAGGAGDGDPAAQYLVLAATASLSAERVFTEGTGISVTDAGAGSTFTVGVNNSVVATLTGSQFAGDVGITGSFLVKSGDFTVESTGEDQALFLDASNNQFYINKGATSFTTIIKNTNNEVFRAGAGGAIFNEYGNKNIDFRVESWNKPYALFVDSENDQILIHSGGGVTSPDESTYADISFLVSGSIGSRGTSTKGASLFGGDLLASGSVIALAGLSGSLQQLSDGTSYLREGSNVTIASASDGSITISSTGGSGSPGGSNTQIQFNDSSAFGGDSTFTFNKATNTLSVPALSGSLTRLVDGTSYLRSGTGISITTGSSGYVQVSNTGVSERQRQSYFLAQSYSAGVNVPVSSTNFATVSYDISLIDVLLNGQLLHSGTAAQVTADPVERDYYVTGTSSLKFAFDIEINDVLDVMVYKVVS